MIHTDAIDFQHITDCFELFKINPLCSCKKLDVSLDTLNMVKCSDFYFVITLMCRQNDCELKTSLRHLKDVLVLIRPDNVESKRVFLAISGLSILQKEPFAEENGYRFFGFDTRSVTQEVIRIKLSFDVENSNSGIPFNSNLIWPIVHLKINGFDQAGKEYHVDANGKWILNT